MNFWDYFQAIVIICAVILAAYYVTKLVAKTGGGAFRKGTGIKQVAALSLGRDKSVTIVEIGETAYILGVSQQHVELIDKLGKEELGKVMPGFKADEPSPATPTFTESFKEELNKRLHKNNQGG